MTCSAPSGCAVIDLGERWGVTRQRARALSLIPGCPTRSSRWAA
jgi:hypothetical protein